MEIYGSLFSNFSCTAGATPQNSHTFRLNKYRLAKIQIEVAVFRHFYSTVEVKM
jgi:hypothetical protein